MVESRENVIQDQRNMNFSSFLDLLQFRGFQATYGTPAIIVCNFISHLLSDIMFVLLL